MENSILRVEDISKHFAGVQALEDVSFSIQEGQIHGLVGENGAGKSTLVKICSGVYQPDGGTLYYKSNPIKVKSTKQAEDMGISVVHQDIPLCTNLTVAQNVFLGPTVAESKYGLFPDWEKINKRTKDLFSELKVEGIEPSRRLEYYSVAERQLVAIARAINRDAEILILDEPTSALPDKETENLLDFVKKLKSQGYTIVYISHKLEEVFAITDSLSVLRNGKHIDTKKTSTVTMDDVVKMMVGKKTSKIGTRGSKPKSGKVVLQTRHISQSEGLLKDISFKLHEGEVLGFAGIKGAGRTELAHAIFGYKDFDSGNILLDGEEVKINSPRAAMDLGLGYLPEERISLGLFFKMSVQENIATTTIDALSHLGFVNRRKAKQLGKDYVDELSIDTPNLKVMLSKLSGGNQQKVLLARWLAATPRILILDEPTRGIDVGTKAEIRNLITELKEEGVSVMLISSELDEVMDLSDRIIVMREGSVNGKFKRSEFTKDSIASKATGATNNGEGKNS